MGLRFNPPPNWPPPPAGFEPGPVWRPDPSWPPAPPGWQLWVDDGEPDWAGQPGFGPGRPQQDYRVSPYQADPFQERSFPADRSYPTGSFPADRSNPTGSFPADRSHPSGTFADTSHLNHQGGDGGYADPPGYLPLSDYSDRPSRQGQRYQARRSARNSGTSGWAVASFVLGLIGVSPLGLIFGLIALPKTGRLRQRGRRLAIAGIVLSCCWALLSIYLITAVLPSAGRGAAGSPSATASGSASKSATGPAGTDPLQLKVGDCFNYPLAAKFISAVTILPCATAHNAQVFARFNLTGSNLAYPATITQLASDGCLARKTSIDVTKTTTSMTAQDLYPPKANWTAGQREVICVIVNQTADLTGSLLK